MSWCQWGIPEGTVKGILGIKEVGPEKRANRELYEDADWYMVERDF